MQAVKGELFGVTTSQHLGVCVAFWPLTSSWSLLSAPVSELANGSMEIGQWVRTVGLSTTRGILGKLSGAVEGSAAWRLW